MARLKKPSDEKLFLLIKNWLGIYLPTERAASQNTIDNYRQSLSQYLDFLAKQKGISLLAITFDMINSSTLNEYLDHLQIDLHFSKATRNNRLAAIRAFIAYASACNPEYVSTAINLAQIKSQRNDTFSKVDYMSETAIKTILAEPDIHTMKGRRDRMLLMMI